MKHCGVHLFVVVSLLAILSPVIRCWGNDGHLTVCRIAQARLSKAAAIGVKKLLPASVGGDLGKACLWANQMKTRYGWSLPLHYINTPTNLCTYLYDRYCKDQKGLKGMCVAGAINNYTDQLLTYSRPSTQYNLTEALLFLSHYIGDIHQPLHVGFSSDFGGRTINVVWFNKRVKLHLVWNTSLIDTEKKRFYSSNVTKLIGSIQAKFKTKWVNQVNSWEACVGNKMTCPDMYASESIKAACQWAYKDVKNGVVLKGEYFDTRLPIVNIRLAQAGVRLAATLNRIFR